MKTMTADFGPALPRASVQLLASKGIIIGTINPDGSPHDQNRMVNVVVQSNGRVVYQYCWLPLTYHAGRQAEDFFSDAELELRDVTNDGIPEILFHSTRLISGPHLHVLEYDATPTAAESFRDVSLPAWDLGYPSRKKLAWFEVPHRTLAVVAVPEGTAHRYELYEWSTPQQRFALQGTVASAPGPHEYGADPFVIDGKYLRAELTRRYSSAPASP